MYQVVFLWTAMVRLWNVRQKHYNVPKYPERLLLLRLFAVHVYMILIN